MAGGVSGWSNEGGRLAAYLPNPVRFDHDLIRNDILYHILVKPYAARPMRKEGSGMREGKKAEGGSGREEAGKESRQGKEAEEKRKGQEDRVATATRYTPGKRI